MIPKKIHYCWFGGNNLSEDAKNYIEGWKRVCPDYEIIEWNESNFDLKYNKYVRQAYENKKWAFVSDVARLFALVEHGGIYLDTDVEVVKELDELLVHNAFLGFEDDKQISTGIMAAEKGHDFFREFLASYTTRTFINEDGSFDETTNVEVITNILLKKGLVQNNSRQSIEGIELYPKDYFSPKSYKTGKIELTKNTYTIHNFNGSWEEDRIKEKRKLARKMSKILPYSISVYIAAIINELKYTGIKGTIMKIVVYIRGK